MAEDKPDPPAAGVPPPAAVSESAPSPSPEPAAPSTSPTPEASTPPPPSLPPRDYSSDVRQLQYVPLAPPLPRDRTLVKFFRFLSSLLFWGGSAAGLSVVLFRLVVLPRLAILSSRLTALHAHHLTGYTTFSDALRALATSNKMLCPRTAEMVAAQAVKAEGEGEVKDEAVQADPSMIDAAVGTSTPLEEPPVIVEKPVEAEKETEKEREEAQDDAVTSQPAATPAPDLSASLRVSLVTLHSEVAAHTKQIETDAEGSPKRLMDSLEQLSSYLTTQTFYATQSKFMAGAASSSNYSVSTGNTPIAPPSQPASEAAAQCRSEIRGLKGLLLNRRNFALLDRAWDGEPTSVH